MTTQMGERGGTARKWLLLALLAGAVCVLFVAAGEPGIAPLLAVITAGLLVTAAVRAVADWAEGNFRR